MGWSLCRKWIDCGQSARSLIGCESLVAGGTVHRLAVAGDWSDALAEIRVGVFASKAKRDTRLSLGRRINKNIKIYVQIYK